MDVSTIFDSLNAAQREAVGAPLGNALVLAGAGSGKTRVLVHRIAYLVQVERVSPYEILSVTFTNKAAAEMRHRVEAMLDIPVRAMWLGTFHGIAHRLLRMHWQEADLPQNFQILDADDQVRLVRRVIKGMKLDEQKWPARQATWFINGAKDEGQRPGHLLRESDFDRVHAEIYEGYEAACRAGGLVDFAELLLRSHELWLKKPDVLAHYQGRFRQLLVDEFQDTNAIQYAWLKVLAGETGNTMAVGDDDQSIYGWRGAKIENIHRFEQEMAPVTVYRLEQNYRSSANILSAANAVIGHNTDRLGKELWTEAGAGEPILLYSAYNEVDESRFIAARAESWIEKGGSPSDVAVLYRSNAQSRVIEDAFLKRDLPYRIYGGLRFFERAEIRDALSYLRLMVNRDSNVAFERVVNTPTRGIGDKTLETVRELARLQSISLWQATLGGLNGGSFSGRAANALAGFVQLINDTANSLAGETLDGAMALVLDASGLEAYHGKDRGERGVAKVENLKELITACKQYTPDMSLPLTEEGATSLADDTDAIIEDFLAHAALEAGESQADRAVDSIQMMTLHSAKGLEFPMVFLTGMEQGVFPHRMSEQEPGRMEEERRLCYVGITRAMQQLYITHAESRRLQGLEQRSFPSTFIREIPKDLLQEVRLGGSVLRPQAAARPDWMNDDGGDEVRLGQTVRHPKFGEGVVVAAEGQGNRVRVRVNFEAVGEKTLMGMDYLEMV